MYTKKTIYAKQDENGTHQNSQEMKKKYVEDFILVVLRNKFIYL